MASPHAFLVVQHRFSVSLLPSLTLSPHGTMPKKAGTQRLLTVMRASHLPSVNVGPPRRLSDLPFRPDRPPLRCSTACQSLGNPSLVAESAEAEDQSSSASTSPETLKEKLESSPLLAVLSERADSDDVAFHFPGHKKGAGAPAELVAAVGSRVLRHDLPELPELDNLFAPAGPILEAQERAAAIFGADSTWFLVNGSTCGIQAAVLATCGPGDALVLPRNCHQSAFGALVLSGAWPQYVAPAYDARWEVSHAVAAESVRVAIAEAAAARRRVGAVLVVSPTYFGVCSDVAAIAEVCHEAGVPLIVDEAHGAHFRFHPELPPTALSCGADVVVQSTHKVLSALTQAAMLHTRGPRVSPAALSRALQLLQSSSPSYLLLSSLDAACGQMALSDGRTADPESPLLTRALGLAHTAREGLQRIQGIEVLTETHVRKTDPGAVALDPLRITVMVSGLGLDGYEVDDILRLEHGVVAELPAPLSLTFAVSGGSRPRDIERLVAAFENLSASITQANGVEVSDNGHSQHEDCVPSSTMETDGKAEGESSLQHEQFLSVNTLAKEVVQKGGALESQSLQLEGLSLSVDAPPPPIHQMSTRGSDNGGSEYTIPSSSARCDVVNEVDGYVGSREDVAFHREVQPWNVMVSPRDAFFAENEEVSAMDAVGRLSAELLCPYPPGIPLIAPGEVITASAIERLRETLQAGGTISGATDVETLRVLKVEKV